MDRKLGDWVWALVGDNTWKKLKVIGIKKLSESRMDVETHHISTKTSCYYTLVGESNISERSLNCKNCRNAEDIYLNPDNQMFRNLMIEYKWMKLNEIPVDQNNCITEPFHQWEQGTSITDIVPWFDEYYKGGTEALKKKKLFKPKDNEESN